MGSMPSGGNASFLERLERIERGGENTIGQIYVGPPSDEELMTRKVKSGKGKAGKRSAKSGPKGMWLALILGVAAFAIARLGLFHGLSEDGAYSVSRFGEDKAQLLGAFGDPALAAVVAIVLLTLFRRRGMLAKVVAFAGIGLGMAGEEQLLLRAPEVYAQLTSESYTANQLAPAPASLPVSMADADVTATGL